LWVQGVVSPGRDEALFSLSSVGRCGTSQEPRLLLPGLDPGAAYRLRPLSVGERPSNLIRPPWLQRAAEEDGVILPGAVLTRSGRAPAPATLLTTILLSPT